MLVTPKVRGFICTTAHPSGCAANVQHQIAYVKQQKKLKELKNVLVIGASTGYGLASRIVATFGANAKTLGVSFEKEATSTKTASPGWYNTSFFEQEALKAGYYAKSINGDAFSHAIKEQTIELIKKELGKIDLIIYSVAAPKRIAPCGSTYNATLKPIGDKYTNKNLNVHTKEVSEISIEPATEVEIENTIKVMGGEDWELWINALKNADLLAKNAITVAYSYIGPEITYPVYRNGTIGYAKEHLEATAKALDLQLQQHCEGNAYVSVNKGLVTQASAAIPVVPLYLSILYKVMKEHNSHEGCIEQIYRLFAEKMYNPQNSLKSSLDLDSRIRIDDWEMDEKIQYEVSKRWNAINTSNLEELADITGYQQDFYNLFGFKIPEVNYDADVAIEVPIPSIKSETMEESIM